MNKSYLDACETNEDKTYQLILNICNVCKYKGIPAGELCNKVGVNKTYLNYCKTHKEIKFSVLLNMCDVLGISLSKLMIHSYANLVTNKQLHENEEKLKTMRSQVAKLETLVKEQRKSLNIMNMK